MKQRLIAATAKEIEALILDEPTNGLDPAGIREIRDTIRDLGAAGVTVLLSSHPGRGPAGLHVRDDHRERPAAGERPRRGPDRHRYAYRLVVPEPDAAKGVLAEAGFAVAADGRRSPSTRTRSPAEITAPSPGPGSGCPLTPVRADLETVFLE